jgi:hypothetical protein
MTTSTPSKRFQSILKQVGWAFFYFHLFLYIGINSLLIVANLINHPQTPWFIIPLSSWGLFLFGHFLVLFFINSRSAKKWRECRISKDVMDKLNLGLTNEELFKKTSTILFAWMIFYFHLAVFLGGSFIIFFINYLVNSQVLWSLIVIISWSIWLAVHFLINYLTTSEYFFPWRSAKIESFIYRKYTIESKKEVYKEATLYFGFWLAFYTHVLLYLPSIFILIISDYFFNTTGQRWFFYPIISWGIFLLAHGLVTYLIISPKLANWRENKLTQLQ